MSVFQYCSDDLKYTYKIPGIEVMNPIKLIMQLLQNHHLCYFSSCIRIRSSNIYWHKKLSTLTGKFQNECVNFIFTLIKPETFHYCIISFQIFIRSKTHILRVWCATFQWRGLNLFNDHILYCSAEKGPLRGECGKILQLRLGSHSPRIWEPRALVAPSFQRVGVKGEVKAWEKLKPQSAWEKLTELQKTKIKKNQNTVNFHLQDTLFV